MGSEIAAVTTTQTKEEVLAAFSAFFAREYPAGGYSCNALPILLAQSALETGAWRSLICFNFGNFKKLSTADFCYFATTEWVPLEIGEKAVAASSSEAPCVEIERSVDGQRMHIRISARHPGACFAAWSTARDGANAFLANLRSRFRLAWAFAMQGDTVKFVRALKQAGYFTADEAAYLRGVSYYVDRWGTPQLATEDQALAAIRSAGYATVSDYQQARGLSVDGDPGPITKNQIRLDCERSEEELTS